MSVLVSGGCGYIGSHTVIELANKNYDIVIIDNLSNSSKGVIDRINKVTGKNVTVYYIDLLDKQSIEYVFSKHQIEYVFHFAGFKAVGESVENPLNYYRNNLLSSINLIETMERYNVYNLVFSSSAAVYGIPESLPIEEAEFTKALNPYGKTKEMIEEILNDLSNSNARWKIISLRYFNPVGAHPSGYLGEKSNGIPNNLMPYICKVASGQLTELKIYGDDYPTVDGTGVRDYIHVVDLAKGHVNAMEYLGFIKGAEVFNLGTGTGYSVLEIVKTFQKATGKEIPYKIVGRRPGDASSSYADPTKAHDKLKWKAEKGLYDMCKDAWKWERNNEIKKKLIN